MNQSQMGANQGEVGAFSEEEANRKKKIKEHGVRVELDGNVLSRKWK